MLGVLLDVEVTKDVLEEEEAVVVGVSESWRVVEDSNIRVNHFVVTDEKERRSIDCSLAVGLFYVSSLCDSSKVLVDSIHKGIVVDGSSSNNDEVVTEIVGGLEVGEVIRCEALEFIRVTLDWLSEHMVTEGVEVSILERHLLIALEVGVVLGGKLLFAEFQLSVVEVSVAHSISQKLNSLCNISFVDRERN